MLKKVNRYDLSCNRTFKNFFNVMSTSGRWKSLFSLTDSLFCIICELAWLIGTDSRSVSRYLLHALDSKLYSQTEYHPMLDSQVDPVI